MSSCAVSISSPPRSATWSGVERAALGQAAAADARRRFVDARGHALLRELPCSRESCEAAADDGDGCIAVPAKQRGERGQQRYRPPRARRHDAAIPGVARGPRRCARRMSARRQLGGLFLGRRAGRVRAASACTSRISELRATRQAFLRARLNVGECAEGLPLSPDHPSPSAGQAATAAGLHPARERVRARRAAHAYRFMIPLGWRGRHASARRVVGSEPDTATATRRLSFPATGSAPRRRRRRGAALRNRRARRPSARASGAPCP